jgi:hypothetical protein
MKPLDDLNEAQYARTQKYAHCTANIIDHLNEGDRACLSNVRVLEIVEKNFHIRNPLSHHLICDFAF